VANVTIRPTSDDHGGFANLTQRQLTILEFVSRGLTNMQISQELHMSKYTVAQHIAEMFKRTGAANRTDLVHRAHTHGAILSFPP
jgi:DNA-binding NarL/FixJ family response regulator